jgi:hypothetical protein
VDIKRYIQSIITSQINRAELRERMKLYEVAEKAKEEYLKKI